MHKTISCNTLATASDLPLLCPYLPTAAAQSPLGNSFRRWLPGPRIINMGSTKNNKIPKNKLFNQGGERLRTMKTIRHWWGFPGGSVVKNPPVHAGDTGRTPHAVEQLGPWAATIEPALWIQELHLLRPRAAATELRAPWSLCSATRSHHKERPTYRNKRKSQGSNQDPAQPKINK